MSGEPRTTPLRAIVFILVAMVAITANDTLIKLLSGGYPLHQMVFVRSVIGIAFTALLLWGEGGLRLLRTDQPGLHAIRAGLIVCANLLFFAALAVLPLGLATALFFVAPLFITALAIPILGERVGAHRIGALVMGLVGVVVIMAPWQAQPEIAGTSVPRGAYLLPVAAALCYAGMQVMTRKLGVKSAASAMAFYIQATFILVSLGFFITVGDGRLAARFDSDSLEFLLRAWIWPAPDDLWKFGLLGLMSGIVGYCLSQAYRIGQAATVASYEYAALPMAILSGWIVFGERPGWVMAVGTGLIALSGLYVFARERQRDRIGPSAERPIRRG